MKTTKYFKTVNEYIAAAPKEARPRLKRLRGIVKKAAPKAEESISYNIPFYKLNGRLVYFAGYQHHVSIYPYKDSMKLTAKELAKYRSGKGTLQFAHDEPLPLVFIEKIIKRRVKEQLQKKK